MIEHSRLVTAVGCGFFVALSLTVPQIAEASCSAPANAIEAENCLAGTPKSTWDISGSGDSSIQGFTTQFSVNQGDTVSFKVKTSASAWRIDVYRMGYYGGAGARLVASVNPSAKLPQSQPACLTDSVTSLIDCGNWAVSATWTVPANATSGIYFGKLIRTDTGGASHVYFVVRNDASHSAILFQTSDATWQAYNEWGGASLYFLNGSYANRARKVSYNRPFITRSVSQGEDFLWNGEYPMVRWLEANGYDVTYTSQIDAARAGALIKNHRLWMSNNHDEYWSAEERASVEAAVAAGVHLAFFSGNKIFWKTRWETSIDGTGTPYRTLVCYKETHDNATTDPADPPTWTGTWRDPRFSPPADGGRPENALGGTWFRINGIYTDAITVPAEDGAMRIWRNTSLATLAPGTVATLAPGTLGAEVDVDEDNGFRPPGLFGVSTNVIATGGYLLDYGSTYGAGVATHRVTIYRHPSGALVFSTGSYQWSWGLDANHDRTNLGATTDVRMQQATVNVFADMGVQPATMQAGLVPASPTTDLIAPLSVVGAPLAGSQLQLGQPVTVSGTASDVGGAVAGVEVSVDGGTTWHPATGRTTWSYTWAPSLVGAVTIRSRAVDDSANLEIPGPGMTVTVTGAGPCTSCTLFAASTVPGTVDGGPDSAVELGVRFRSDVAGTVTGIRFYKAATNTGTHVANLWSSAGTLLATATFAGETASGWQQVSFPTPVAVTAGTTYVASYHCNGGHYSADLGFFLGRSVDSPPLHAPADAVGAPNGVYRYGAASAFPDQTWNSSNYWVDLVFTPAATPTLVSIAVTPANPVIGVSASIQLAATGTYTDGSTQDLTAAVTWASSSAVVATVGPSGLATGEGLGTATISAALGSLVGSTTLTVQSTPLAVYTASLPSGTVGVAYSANLNATGGTSPYSWAITAGSLPPGLSLSAARGSITGTPTSGGTYAFTASVTDGAGATASRALSIAVASAAPVSLFGNASPVLADSGADKAVELGVRFSSDIPGYVRGIRFYKSSTNTGTHVGNLWTSTGTKLATVTFTSESASGWQTATFSPAVAISANTVYVASYHTDVGHYAADAQYFATKGVDAAPLHSPADTPSGPNGSFAYGSTSVFPSKSFKSSNYWVDVLFSPVPAATLSSIAIAPSSATISTGATQQFTATGTYSDGTIRDLSSLATWSSSSPAVATISSTGLAAALAAGTTTIAASSGGVSGTATLTVQAVPLAITTASLTGGTQYLPYSATLDGSGGAMPYTWSISAGALPPGLTLSPSTGTISGTPTTAGTYALTVQLKDATAQTVTKALSIVVAAAPALSITTTSLPDATVGVAYSATLAATGGAPPYTWSIPAGLPPGLTLGAGTGTISGTPASVGAYAFTTSVTDSVSGTASRSLGINVLAPTNYTIWPSTQIPGLIDAGADSSVELGVKFRSDVAGKIKGIRFYKASGNTGTHVGALWTSTGTLLANATFTGESASGWQQVLFSTPVAITANTIYVASYHCNSGHYSADSNYFATSGYDSTPLHALAATTSPNGVYAYGTGTRFPNQTYLASNYWVDVVFSPTSQVPTLSTIAVTPANGTVSTGTTLQMTATGTYSDGSTQNVTAKASWSSSVASVATIDAGGLVTPFNPGTTTLTATVGGISGSTGLTVQAGVPPPSEGPGGPILVVTNSGNPFARYLAEILRAEGLQAFTATDISLVSAATLAVADVVILGDSPLTSAQAAMFSSYVTGGGNLVAMHPDKQLAPLLGLTDAGGTLSDAYLKVNTTSGPGVGIVADTIQFHSSADLYLLNGATAIATLYSSAATATTSPAVTLRAVGSGQAAAFTYDLARSVALTRQGNPAWSGQDRDGLSPTRSDDLFFGAAVADPKPDWVDLSKVAIPQADEQQRLFVNLLLQMNQSRRPLPRFWYFPGAYKAVVVMTGDDHAGGGTAGRFDQYIQDSPSGCNLANWECIRSTSYLYPNSPLTPSQATYYTGLGFEVAAHVTTNCLDFTSYADLDSYYTPELAAFAAYLPTAGAPRTNRTHCVVWSDYDTQPRVELAHGIRLDTTYYYWPGSWVNDRPGFMTGSGIPMRYTDRSGALIDVYQAATQMTDESGQTYPATVNALLDAAVGASGYYGVFTANMHTDQVTSTGSDAIIASAAARGVPVVSAKQMLDWLDGRNASSFGGLGFTGGLLSFTVTAASSATNLQAMLPATSGALTLASITRSGVPVVFQIQVVKGVSYAKFPVTTGAYQATYR